MTDPRRTICLIPARGSSKRIPRKNIKPFLGKPIIAWPIETALSTDLFDQVIVSTDDSEIADIATAYGASVPFMRPDKMADDHATITDVISDTLDTIACAGHHYDYMFMVYATAPNVKVADIQSGFTLLKDKNYDTVFSIVKFSFPIQRALHLDDAGTIEYIEPQHAYTRSQDLPERYHDAGQWIWIDIKKFMANGRHLIAGNSGAIALNPMFFHDIDDETDWQIAEQKMKLQEAVNNI